MIYRRVLKRCKLLLPIKFLFLLIKEKLCILGIKNHATHTTGMFIIFILFTRMLIFPTQIIITLLLIRLIHPHLQFLINLRNPTIPLIPLILLQKQNRFLLIFFLLQNEIQNIIIHLGLMFKEIGVFVLGL